MKFTGKTFTAERTDRTNSSNISKVIVEKLYTDDYKNLLQYGAEKDLEQAEGKERSLIIFLYSISLIGGISPCKQ